MQYGNEEIKQQSHQYHTLIVFQVRNAKVEEDNQS